MKTIKEALNDKIVTLIENPHTSGSAFLFLALKIAGAVKPAWKPTLDEIASLAVGYGFIMAGDAKPKGPQ